MGDLDQIGIPDDDELQRRYQANQPPAPTIARPQASSVPPMAIRGINPAPPAAPSTAAQGSPEEMEDGAAKLRTDIGNEQQANRIPSALGTRKTNDESELNRLVNTGSGISQISHGSPEGGIGIAKPHRVAGGFLRGIETLGNIAAPWAMAQIPGTELHHNTLVNSQRGAVSNDNAAAQSEAATEHTQAQTEEIPSTIAKNEAETAALQNPAAKPKEEKWSEFAGFTDTDGTPLIREENSGQVVRADTKKPPTGFKAAAPKVDRPDSPEQQFIDDHIRTHPGATVADAVAAYSRATQKPEKAGAESARSDKSYSYNNDKLDKLGKPIEDAVARMGRLRETLAQGTPQADALVAPELLTIMAGGSGSGLRMNEAEISRIVGGRSKWQSLEASINQWRLDPTKANTITPEQRQQIRGLTDAVNTKLQKKQEALDAAREGLLNSDDPKEHRRIVTDAHHTLSQIDGGDQQGQGGGGEAVYATNPKTKERVMSTDGGKTWNPAK